MRGLYRSMIDQVLVPPGTSSSSSQKLATSPSSVVRFSFSMRMRDATRASSSGDRRDPERLALPPAVAMVTTKGNRGRRGVTAGKLAAAQNVFLSGALAPAVLALFNLVTIFVCLFSYYYYLCCTNCNINLYSSLQHTVMILV